MRVMIKEASQALSTNVSKLTDELDACSRQIDMMGEGFESEQLKGNTWDAIRAELKNLKIPAAKAQYSALEAFASACKSDSEEIMSLPESHPGVCDTDEFKELIKSYESDEENARAQADTLRKTAEGLSSINNPFLNILMDLADNFSGTADASAQMADLYRSDLQKAETYCGWSKGVYGDALDASNIVMKSRDSIITYINEGKIADGSWRDDADKRYTNAFAKRVNYYKDKIIGTDGSGLDDAYLKELLGNKYLTPEQVEALAEIYLDAVRLKEENENSALLDRLVNSGYYDTFGQNIGGDTLAGTKPNPCTLYNVTYIIRPGYKYFLKEVLKGKVPKRSKVFSKYTICINAMCGIASGLLANVQVIKIINNYYPGVTGKIRVKLNEEKGTLGVISFGDDSKDIVFAYRGDALENANTISTYIVKQNLKPNLSNDVYGHIKSEFKSGVTTEMYKAVNFTGMEIKSFGIAGTVVGTLSSYADRAIVAESICMSIDKSTYIHTHFATEGTVVYTNGTTISAIRFTKEERALNEQVTRLMEAEGLSDTVENRVKWLPKNPQYILKRTGEMNPDGTPKYTSVLNTKEDDKSPETNRKMIINEMEYLRKNE